MKLAQGLKLGFCGIGLALIAACSSTPGGVGASVSDLTSAFSSGLGKRASFSGQEAGEVYTTKAPHNQVYLFPFDNSVVAEKYLPSIEAQAQYLKRNPKARIMLAGHTDERGSREYNVALGERRANSVADLLRMAGVSNRQMRIVSYGEERPVAFEHNAASYRKNRRVELTYEATR